MLIKRSITLHMEIIAKKIQQIQKTRRRTTTFNLSQLSSAAQSNPWFRNKTQDRFRAKVTAHNQTESHFRTNKGKSGKAEAQNRRWGQSLPRRNLTIQNNSSLSSKLRAQGTDYF